jgi:hypothetical protein
MKTHPLLQRTGCHGQLISRSRKFRSSQRRSLVPAKNVLPLRFAGNIESLENRYVLSGNPLVSGNISSEGQVEQVELTVSLPDADQGATVVLGLHASSSNGFDLAAPVARLTPTGASLFAVAAMDDMSPQDPTGGTYLELATGTYFIDIFGDGGAATTGEYQLEVFVLGDSDSMDGSISDMENTTALAAYFQGIGGGNFVSEQFFRQQGVDLNLDHYNPNADADADGRIGIHDLNMVAANALLGEVDLELSIDDDPPIVTAGLANDTGVGVDLLTTDPTIAGNVSDESDIVSLLVSVNGSAQVDRIADLNQATGDFTWNQSALESVSGSGLLEGDQSVSITAVDGVGLSSQVFNFEFTYFMNDAPQLDTGLGAMDHDEDVLFSAPTASNFSDADSLFGDVLSFSAVQTNGVDTPLPGWLSIDPETGLLSGTPLNDDVRAYDIKVTATDTEGASADDIFSLTINPIANDAPEIVGIGIPDQTATDTVPFSLNLNGFFTDPDLGDSIASISVINGGSLPAWLNLGDGVLSGSPGISDLGTVNLTATATDTTGLTVSDDFDLNVLFFNDSPELVQSIDDQVVDEDSPFELNILNNFTDPDLAIGDSLTWSTSDLPGWLSFDASAGTFSGTPANDDVGNSTVTVTATDNVGLFASDDFELSVADTNDAPEVSIADRTAPIDTPFSLNLRDLIGQTGGSDFIRDVDAGDEATLSIDITDALPGWLLFDDATDTLSGTPGVADIGSFDVTVGVADSVTTTFDEFTIDVQVTTARPTISTIPTQTATVGENFLLDLESFVQDADTPLVNVGITAIQADGIDSLGGPINGRDLPGWLTVDTDFSSGPSGIQKTFSDLTGTPAIGDVGSFMVFVQAFDETLTTPLTSTIFTMNVVEEPNEAPFLIGAIGAQTANDGQPFSFDVSSFFGDPDGDDLDFAATQNGGSTLPDWLTLNAETGVFSGTPDDADIASLTINVTASDPGPLEVDGSFTLNVVNTPESPILVQNISDRSAAVGALFTFDISGNFSDPDAGDTLSFTAQTNVNGLPTWLGLDMTTGVFSGTPGSNDAGVVDITVTATDTTQRDAGDTFRLTIAANAPPTAGDDGPFDTDNNVSLLISGSELLDNDTDPEDDPRSITEVASTSTLGARITFDGSTIIYDPIPAVIFNGGQLQDTFTYTITDGSSTDTADVTVNLTGASLIEFQVKFFEFVGPNDPSFFDFNGDGNHDLATPEISQIGTGEKFVAAIFVEDVQPPVEADGVFSAFVDVTFPDDLVTLDGGVIHSLNYGGATNSNLATPGLIDEAGGLGPISPFPNPAQFELFRVNVDAGSNLGTATFATDTKEAPNREILIYRAFTGDVPVEQIGFGSNSIEIVSGSSAASSGGITANPNDVNGDGEITPFDALVVINMMEDPQAASSGSAVSHELCDVNRDGQVTPFDALLVINELENGDAEPVAAMSSSAVSAPHSAMSASVSVVTTDDEFVINPIANNEAAEAEFDELGDALATNVEETQDAAMDDYLGTAYETDQLTDGQVSLADAGCDHQHVDEVFADLDEELS